MLAILLILVSLLLVVTIAAATRPDSFRVERSALIQATPERIFPLVNDFHAWGGWSPWEKLDPDLKREFSGEAQGPGAIYAWEGNPKVGKGRMEILESTAPSRLRIKLDFLKPFEAHNEALFTLATEGTATRVTWTMTGPQPFPMKVMGLFMSMDGMVGKDFEKGLAGMKALAEA